MGRGSLGYTYTNNQQLAGREAWQNRYDSSAGWTGFGLGEKVGAFIEGGANFLWTMGVPIKMAIAIVAVLVASFAATTLDTATRLQRYVIQELAITVRMGPLQNRYSATLMAVVLGGAVALFAGDTPGEGLNRFLAFCFTHF